MRWFTRWKKSGSTPPEAKRAKGRTARSDPKPAKNRNRRERYSGWNDPDLPTYGDPFDD
jgi:hypothetical protein